MNTKPVRTRFAPSPTGRFHLGNARSALFPYLWARQNKGAFILRIEDTDQAREVPGAVENIIDSLKWLNLSWDEGPDIGGDFGPYIQSARTKIYQEHAQQLLEQGKAYRCFCSAERLAAMRVEQTAKKFSPRYDRLCRNLSTEERQQKISQNIPYVVRLKVPEEGSIEVHDLLRGEISFPAADIDDQILLKSDGFPTYHLANVIDDHLMQITYVIRGEDWLPSTPKHVLLYQYFGWPMPEFVHLSLFLSPTGGKMSKRAGADAVLDYRRQGYFSAALVNFIALLGWNPKTAEEVFNLDELVKRFDLKMINTANPIVDENKLNWLNAQYLQKLDVGTMVSKIEEVAADTDEVAYQKFLRWYKLFDAKKQKRVWEMLKTRCTTLLDVAKVSEITTPPQYQAKDLVWKKSSVEKTLPVLQKLIAFLEQLAEKYFTAQDLEKALFNWIKQQSFGVGDVLWPMRFALSGALKSPPPFELADLLGKDETLKRIRAGLKALVGE